jgi:inosose dehydratase
MLERTTMSTARRTGASQAAIFDRVAAGPISWGVCEVPNWGIQLPPDRVLSEMRSLGIVGTEAGPDGYLGDDAARVRALLERNGLELVGGFLPVVLHDPAQLEASLAKVRRTAAFFAELGGQVLCSAAVVDDDWSPRIELSESQWEYVFAALPLIDQAASEHGIVHALHPHWGTIVERDGDVMRVLERSNVGICLDTGHLALGGSDALDIARAYAHRVVHVHLKDVSDPVANRLRSGELDLVMAVQAGLFRPLGAGDARVDQVVVAFEQAGYAGWYVLEQDTAITGAVPVRGHGPVDDVRRSVEFLQAVVHGAVGVVPTTEGA